MMLEVTFVLTALFAVLALVSPQPAKELSVEAQEAVTTLLNFGACIELNRWHLYKTKSGKYALMQFDDKSDIVRDSERCFENVEDAVRIFVEKTRGVQKDD